jgi:phage-related protein
VVYVLHAFQKKSMHGIATPPQEMDKIRARLKRAGEEYEAWKTRNP